jgi:transcriptional regulator with XRE-family HTH domain
MMSMHQIDYVAIGKRIRAERKKQDLTQEQLAELADISESFMGHIERGGRTPSVETLMNISNALNLSIEYIVCGEYSYQPSVLPSEICDFLSRMSDYQREVFLSIMRTLAEHPDTWPIGSQLLTR